MQHSFDISIAETYGVNVAIFLNNIAFWIKKNQANQKHFHEGRYWTYNSQESFTELFPYWTRQNIRTILKLCEDQNLIIKGNFNETNYDRTTWYALTDLGLSLFSCFNNVHDSLGGNQPMESNKSTHSLVRINQPIPDINTYIKPDKRKERGKNIYSPHPTFICSKFESCKNHKELADELHLDVVKELSAFKDYYRATGKRMSDWNAAFNNWLRKAAVFQKHSQRNIHSVTKSIQDLKERSPAFREFLSSVM